MKSAMKISPIAHLFWISFFCILFIYPFRSNAQVGIGAEALFSHPGITKSKELNISLDPSFGYGFFFKHPVYSSYNLEVKLRYSADIIDHDLKINGINYKYSMSNFNGSILIYFSSQRTLKYYSGIVLQFVSIEGRSKFRRNYSDDILLPAVTGGITYPWAEGFDFYGEALLQIGKTSAGPEDIPLNGFTLKIGLTMYLLNDES